MDGTEGTTEQDVERGTGQASTTVEDSNGLHFVRYLGISMLLSLANAAVVGIIWTLVILTRTGYRKRDYLLLLVPVVGWIVGVRAIWRYTAKQMYWTPRDDRPSAPMPNGGHPALVALGYGSFVGLIALAVIVGPSSDEWTSEDRRVLQQELESNGIARPTATCMVDFVEDRYPTASPTRTRRSPKSARTPSPPATSRSSSAAGAAVDELARDVHVAHVAGGLLDQVHDDPAQGGGTYLALRGQIE